MAGVCSGRSQKAVDEGVARGRPELGSEGRAGFRPELGAHGPDFDETCCFRRMPWRRSPVANLVLGTGSATSRLIPGPFPANISRLRTGGLAPCWRDCCQRAVLRRRHTDPPRAVRVAAGIGARRTDPCGLSRVCFFALCLPCGMQRASFAINPCTCCPAPAGHYGGSEPRAVQGDWRTESDSDCFTGGGTTAGVSRTVV